MGPIQINASELITVRDDGFLFHALGSVSGEANPSDFLTFSNLLFEGDEALVDVAIEIVPGQFALDEARLPFLVAGSLTASSFTIDLGPIGFAPTNTEDIFITLQTAPASPTPVPLPASALCCLQGLVDSPGCGGDRYEIALNQMKKPS
ncbi:MAG: hypothetical protein ABJG75_09840 [Roseobacter sp.]